MMVVIIIVVIVAVVIVVEAAARPLSYTPPGASGGNEMTRYAFSFPFDACTRRRWAWPSCSELLCSTN